MVSALGGLLFGYDWVVIGGAKPFYEPYFGISGIPSMQGWAMSCALVGCIIGALISGVLSDQYGRKRLLILSAALFVIASIGTGSANIFPVFIAFRIIGGIGIGLASNLSPMYIAEITPANVRGSFVSINQLTIVIGILAAQFINYRIAEPVAKNATINEILLSWNGQMGWRWMFYACAIPALIFFILMWFVPESPRWLAKNNSKHDKVFKILRKIGGDNYARNELLAIKQTQKPVEEKSDIKTLLQPNILNLLVIGIVLAAFQQWCGINVIFNYAQEVFAAAGYAVTDILFNIVITGSVNLVFTFVGMYMVDKLGRKGLLLIGSGGLAIIYAIVGTMYYIHIQGLPLLIFVVTAIAVYATTLAPVTWVVLSEIFPNRIRGRAMSISTIALWIASFLLTYSFPILKKYLNASGTFWLYGFICVAGFIFIFKKLIETKNKSLEDIEKQLTGN
jgi:SP family sugar porter-like MFS transporter